LLNGGPQTVAELPGTGAVSREMRADGVRKFNPRARSEGSVAHGGGQKRHVYYVDGKHDPETVIRAWMDANPKTVASISDWALHQRIAAYGDEWRAASRSVLAPFDREFHGGGHETGGSCPLCGEEHARSLAHHLPCDSGDADPDIVPDGGLPTRAAVADAIRACHADGLTHVKMRHICARLDGHERDQTGVAKSVGQTCARFAERGALDQWSGSRGSGRSVWKIVDVDKLPRSTGRADGGDRRRECHACGATTSQVPCPACFAVPWTDYPVDHDAALIRASRLRNAADRLETRAAARPGGGDA
jgi:hypothetical protein